MRNLQSGEVFLGRGVTADPNDEQALIRWRGKSMGKEQHEGGDLGKYRVQGAVRCEMMPERQARLQLMEPVGHGAMGSPWSAVVRGEAGTDLQRLCRMN